MEEEELLLPFSFTKHLVPQRINLHAFPDLASFLRVKKKKRVRTKQERVEESEFLACCGKVAEEIQAAEEDDYIFVKTESKGKLLKINLADIDFIESMKNYVAIHRGGQKTLVYTSMKELEERLPKKQFIRVHKSFIIPISRITGIEGNLVRLKNTTAEILIGENYKAELMEIIRGKMIQ